MRGDAPRLVAHLDVPGDPVDLALPAGAVHLLAADAEVARPVLAALTDADPERDHRVALDGRPLERAGRARRVRAGLVVLDTPQLAFDVSVHDHLAAVVRPREAEALLARIPQLAERRNEPAGVLSGGERRLLAWLGVIARHPRCVVLVRAGTGLDRRSLDWAHTVIDGWLADRAVVLIHPGRAEEAAWAVVTADGEPR